MPPDCRRWKKAWFQNPRQWSIRAGPCSTVGRNPQWETSFCVVYLESVGDHTSSKVSFDCFERIMLKRCRQWLEEQKQLTIIRIPKIPDANMINTIGPRQLPCGTVYIETFRAVLVDESILSATREKGPNPFLCVANNPEVSLRDF